MGVMGRMGALDLLFMNYDLLFGLDSGEWGGFFGRGGQGGMGERLVGDFFAWEKRRRKVRSTKGEVRRAKWGMRKRGVDVGNIKTVTVPIPFGTRIAFQQLIITFMPEVVLYRAISEAANYFCAA